MNCPYHANKYPAADRAAIWQDLHTGFNEATTVLANASTQYKNDFEPYAADLPTTILAPQSSAPDGKRYEFASKNIEAFAATLVATKYASSDFEPLRMPIGRAGENAAAHTLASVGWLAQLCDKPGVDAQLDVIADNYADVLLNHTFRGVSSGDPRNALRNELQQGLAIIGHSYGMLTIDTLPNEISQVEQLLVSQKRIQLLARSIGNGAMLGLMRNARHIPSPLNNANFSKELEGFTALTREDSRAQVAETRQIEDQLTEFDADVHLIANMGGTCPATKGPIQVLSTIVAEHNRRQRAFGG